MSQHNPRGVTSVGVDPSGGQFAAMFSPFEHIPAHKHPHKSCLITEVAAAKLAQQRVTRVGYSGQPHAGLGAGQGKGMGSGEPWKVH